MEVSFMMKSVRYMWDSGTDFAKFLWVNL